MIGPLVLIVGLLGLWALVRGKAGPVLDAIIQPSFSTSLDNSLGNTPLSSGGTSNSTNISAGNSTNAPDSGSHQGLVNGVIVTIDKSYADMTNAEKDAANAYAHQIGNV